ncbi:DNA adenine methylase [Spiroplasma endosymbiont of Cantharis rufa]|uniref:DNA adenine methylase n=1 Tax=Spiroplasma endosymbiont of Cantharis rufa TaxID=3066279 RepID=UPI0030CF16F4
MLDYKKIDRNKLTENKNYLKQQIITYLGNKRALIEFIEQEIKQIQSKLKNNKTINVDLFSGSGIVSRMLKKYSSKLISNDLELYSYFLNKCYLTNINKFNDKEYEIEKNKVLEFMKNNQIRGHIYNSYAPKNIQNIKINERVFYTTENAIFIDTLRNAIDKVVKEEYKIFFLAPLLVESSIKNNTAGLFKGFYKDKNTGVGKFGGTGEYALSRIKSKIVINKPILSNFNCKVEVRCEDANELAKQIKYADIVYLDPPYNQHPYGSNYFMLNIIAKNKIESDISKISGIPKNWNRSVYNKKSIVLNEFEKLIHNLRAKYIIISYNSEGFMKIKDIELICKKYGEVSIKDIPYNTFRGSRNLNERSLYVSEYLIVLEKRGF